MGPVRIHLSNERNPHLEGFLESFDARGPPSPVPEAVEEIDVPFPGFLVVLNDFPRAIRRMVVNDKDPVDRRECQNAFDKRDDVLGLVIRGNDHEKGKGRLRRTGGAGENGIIG